MITPTAPSSSQHVQLAGYRGRTEQHQNTGNADGDRPSWRQSKRSWRMATEKPSKVIGVSAEAGHRRQARRDVAQAVELDHLAQRHHQDRHR